MTRDETRAGDATFGDEETARHRLSETSSSAFTIAYEELCSAVDLHFDPKLHEKRDIVRQVLEHVYRLGEDSADKKVRQMLARIDQAQAELSIAEMERMRATRELKRISESVTREGWSPERTAREAREALQQLRRSSSRPPGAGR